MMGNLEQQPLVRLFRPGQIEAGKGGKAGAHLFHHLCPLWADRFGKVADEFLGAPIGDQEIPIDQQIESGRVR